MLSFIESLIFAADGRGLSENPAPLDISSTPTRGSNTNLKIVAAYEPASTRRTPTAGL
jgi:hypothetical protein